MARRPYPYHSRLRRAAARLADGMGDLLLGDRRSRPAGPPDPHEVQRALVVRPDHLGDVVFATAALRPLRLLYPKAAVTALVGPWAAPLLLHHPDADEVVSFRNPWFDRGKFSGARDVFDVLQWMRRRRFDVGLDLRGDPRVIALLAAGRVRYRVGYGWGGAGFLLSREMDHPPGVHQVERNVAVVRTLGWRPADGFVPRPLLRVSGPERETMDRRLAEGAWGGPPVGARDRLAVLHPGAGFPSKRWRLDRFAALARWLAAERGYRAVLVGGPEERGLAGEVLRTAGPGRALDLAGRLSLRELMALLSRADLMVGNDSGPTHMAAALGTRTVALFSGTNDAAEWAPAGPGTRVLRKDVPCSPCGLKVCAFDHHGCMEGLALEDVQEAVTACESS
ncbi:MAG: glycosyltransferase family 9 protein [Candidatus Tectomicrobia bacterium]|nr:glycosyltransferase family 9 protein [Candidatus Tectomicrobia bacterium]